MTRVQRTLAKIRSWERNPTRDANNTPIILTKDGRRFCVLKLGVHDLFAVSLGKEYIGRFTGLGLAEYLCQPAKVIE